MAVGIFLWLMVLGAAAKGQEIPRGVGSADRPRPEYKPVGLRKGSFFIYPSVSIESAYDDNIFASEKNTVHDFKVGVAPKLNVKSDWRRHNFSVLAYGNSIFHADTSRENYTDWGIHGQSRLDLSGTTSIEARAAFDQVNQDRVNINATSLTKHRVVYDQASGEVRIRHTFNQLEFMLKGQILTFDFKDAELLSGDPVDQDFRDRMELGGLVEASYVFSPGYAAFIQANINQRNYELSPGDPGFNPETDFNRDSYGYEIEAGLALELTNLLYGNIRAGYIKQTYQTPALANVDAPAFGAGLLWNVTTLTSIRLDGDRRVEDSTIPFSGGRLMSEVTLGVDHELLRNLIITLEGGYRKQDFRGIDRSDNYYRAESGIRYLFTPRVTFEARYQYEARRSSCKGELNCEVQEFNRNVVQAFIEFHL